MFGIESPLTPVGFGSADALSFVEDWSESYCVSRGVFARCSVVRTRIIKTPADLGLMAVKAPPS